MTAAIDTRRREVQALLDRLRRWAAERADVRAVALVGSWAHGDARIDSDVDVVLLTTSVATYAHDDGWVGELGAEAVSRTRNWGVLTERRLALPSGLELEVGVVAPSWAATAPVDPGTARVASDGLVALHDPHGLLAGLVAAIGDAPQR